ncbi:MAG: hypothetical protein SW833_02735 [Cyanobacteriota bacterium]|nr:hypothetical protein [Cyanobacteriota bacterium]
MELARILLELPQIQQNELYLIAFCMEQYRNLTNRKKTGELSSEDLNRHQQLEMLLEKLDTLIEEMKTFSQNASNWENF